MALVIEIAALLAAAAMSMVAGLRITPPVLTSPWLMPLIVGVAMTIVAALLLVQEVLARRAVVNHDPGETGASWTTARKMSLWLVLTIAYVIAVPIIGFEWSTLAFLLVALRLFASVGWKVIASVSLVMALLIPLIFRHVFLTLVP